MSLCECCKDQGIVLDVLTRKLMYCSDCVPDAEDQNRRRPPTWKDIDLPVRLYQVVKVIDRIDDSLIGPFSENEWWQYEWLEDMEDALIYGLLNDETEGVVMECHDECRSLDEVTVNVDFGNGLIGQFYAREVEEVEGSPHDRQVIRDGKRERRERRKNRGPRPSRKKSRKYKPLVPDGVEVYPDTEAGALKCVKEDSTHDFTDCECIADPQVEGVWKVTTPKDTACDFVIVYLAGYREPLGRIRQENDFESCES